MKQKDLFEAPPKVAAKVVAKRKVRGALTKDGKFKPSAAKIRKVEEIRKKVPF